MWSLNELTMEVKRPPKSSVLNNDVIDSVAKLKILYASDSHFQNAVSTGLIVCLASRRLTMEAWMSAWVNMPSVRSH